MVPTLPYKLSSYSPTLPHEVIPCLNLPQSLNPCQVSPYPTLQVTISFPALPHEVIPFASLPQSFTPCQVTPGRQLRTDEVWL